MTEWEEGSGMRGNDAFAGEDEEDALDNWDDDDDDEAEAIVVTPVVKKLTLKQKIALKEEKRLEEKMAEKLKMQQETPEEMAERKRREKEMQEESDLLMAAESFGVSDPCLDGSSVSGEIDAFKAVDASDFDKFNDLLVTKITSFKDNENYSAFVEKLSTELVIRLNVTSIKKIGSSFTSIANEKSKAEKALKKGKGKSKKGKLNVTKNDNQYSNFDDYDDMDDFI